MSHNADEKNFFTSGEVAKMCGVQTNTVKKWFDSGRLKGYRINGKTGARRIARSELADFLKEQDISLDNVLGQHAVPSVLYIGNDPYFCEKAFGGNFSFTAVADLFAAGMAFNELRPRCVVIDYSACGMSQGSALGSLLRSLPSGKRPLVVAIGERGADFNNADMGFSKPFEHALFASEIERKLKSFIS